MIFLIFWFIIIRTILHISFKLYKFYHRNKRLRKFINRILSLTAQIILAILCSTCHVVLVIVFIFIIFNQTFFQYPLQLL